MPASHDRSPHEVIQEHPYIETSGSAVARELVAEGAFASMVQWQQDIFEEHLQMPVDMLVGDDVSGRVPTLITHRFLQLALLRGRVDRAPSTVFVASGMVNNGLTNADKTKELWRANTQGRAAEIFGRVSASRVMVVTELSVSGESLGRIKEAFSASGVKVSSTMPSEGHLLHLRDMKSERDSRLAIGVEKSPPEATSRRISKFDGQKSARLRRFLDDYAIALYDTVFSSFVDSDR